LVAMLPRKIANEQYAYSSKHEYLAQVTENL
jgi:hypothetical protein